MMLTHTKIIQYDIELLNNFIKEQLSSDVELINQISHYIVEAGGKRIRPIIVLLTAKSFNLNCQQHITLATIIELLHTATLLHDDVVDHSMLRRGKKTVNAQWGNSPSILVGDYLYSRAFQIMVQLNKNDILKVLSNATNIIAEGEVMQLMHIKNLNIQEEDYFSIIKSKTAQLFEASSHSAVLLSDQPNQKIDAAKAYGFNIGMAFQLSDDLLDFNGNPNIIGKNLGNDLLEGKITLPIIYALSNCNKADKKILQESIKTNNLNTETVNQIIFILKKNNSFKYTHEKINQYIKTAIDQLNYFKQNNYTDALESLALSAMNRNK